MMQALKIDEEIWQMFPEARFEVLVVKGINNRSQADEPYQELLDSAIEKSQKYIANDVFRDNPVVSEWRTAFTKFKKKKGARSSIEALLKRVSQRKSLNPINPLVDIYNSISLEYGVPCGGEDL
ncbi:Lysine--tRNA ligase [Pediococcus pentosaceus]|nr:Lysine--tRNA ligase [Pediococcus pentosaceus]